MNSRDEGIALLRAYDEAVIGIFRSTFQGKFIYVNKRIADILKYDSPEDMITSITDIEKDLFVKKERQKILEVIKREGYITNYEVEYYCKDGSIITALLSMRLVPSSNNECFLEGYVNDITPIKLRETIMKEKEENLKEVNLELESALQQLKANEAELQHHYDLLKEKEKALAESEERWYFALQGSENGVWDWNLETNHVFRSQQYKLMRGYSVEEIDDDYSSWISEVHPEDLNRVLSLLDAHLNNITPVYSAKYRIRRKDHSYMWIHEKGKVMVRDSTGKPLRMVGTHININDVIAYQEAIHYQKNLFESLFNNSLDAIVYFDNKGRVMEVNPRFTEVFGYTLEEIKGKDFNEVIDPDDLVDNDGTMAILRGEPFFYNDEIRYNKVGKGISVMVRGIPVSINGNNVGGYGIYTDMTPLKAAEDKIKNQQKILESLFTNSPDAIAHMDLDGTIVEVNPMFTEIFGYAKEEAIGNKLGALIVPYDETEKSDRIQQLLSHSSKQAFDLVRKRKDGSLVSLKLRGGPTFSEGKTIGFHTIYTDITEQKKAEEKIRFLSYHDKLTGLYNRAYFEEVLDKMENNCEYPFALIIGDVNGLKLTNDVFGHLEGDQLLKKIANIFVKASKEQDVVCRWGGDEFAVLMPNSDERMAREVCSTIATLSESLSQEIIKISIATGFSVKHNSSNTIDDVIKDAEEKMYRHKLMADTSMRSNLVTSLQKTLFEKSHETEEHAIRMKTLSRLLGEKLDLDPDQLAELSLLAVIHDIGKIAISDVILNKPDKLDEKEWHEMKKHTEIGYRIAITNQELMHIAKYILYHHERWDGTGYPQGLKKYDIPLLSRIISIIDAYDVMTHSRPYKEALTHEEALQEVARCAGSQFDPNIAKIFIEMFS